MQKSTIVLFCILALFLWLTLDPILISLIGLTLGTLSIFKAIRDFGEDFLIFDLAISLTYLQLVITPFCSYRLDSDILLSDKFVMSVGEKEYMLYVVPCLVITQIVLYSYNSLFRAKFKKSIRKIEANSAVNIFIGKLLIFVGVVGTLIGKLLPGTLQFVFFLCSCLPFIGFFYLWVSRFKYRNLVLAGVLSFLFITTFREAIFINFFVWLIFIFSIVLHKKKIRVVYKLIITPVLLFSLVALQITKHAYRQVVWLKGEEPSVSLFFSLGAEALNEPLALELGAINLLNRLNQGFILSKVIDHTKEKKKNSSQIQEEFKGILFPRFLYPNKLKVNTGEKITKFTGWRMIGSTTMSIGLHGDGYGNFGYWGGIFFIFSFFAFQKLVYNCLCILSEKISSSFVLWIPFIFFYSIRPGSEFYIIGNWIVKSIVFFLMLNFFFKYFVNKYL